MPDHQFVLTLSCPDRPGIVSAVSTFLAHNGQNILDAQQFNDVESGHFFMRVVFTAADLAVQPCRRCRPPSPPSRNASAWTGKCATALPRRRVMLLVSKFDHCLVDILYRWRIGELGWISSAIVSNHPRETYVNLTSRDSVSYLPVIRETRREQQETRSESYHGNRTDLVVLARYMQILSHGLGEAVGRCINIHHSFLPGFRGASPTTRRMSAGSS